MSAEASLPLYCIVSTSQSSRVQCSRADRNDTYDSTWNFLNPFTYIIWILIGFTIIALVGFFTLLDLIVRNNPKIRMFSLLRSFWCDLFDVLREVCLIFTLIGFFEQ